MSSPPEPLSGTGMFDPTSADVNTADLNRGHMPSGYRKDRGDPLVLGRDAGGPRWFLAGRPIHCGSALELRLPGGVWASVVFQVEYDSCGRCGQVPVLYLAVGGSWEDWRPPAGTKEGDEVEVPCDECAVVPGATGTVKNDGHGAYIGYTTCQRCDGRSKVWRQVVAPGAPRVVIRPKLAGSIAGADTVGFDGALFRWPS